MLNHKGTLGLVTDRLKLRKLCMSDAADMFKNYATDERVARFLNWRPYKHIDDVETFLLDSVRNYQYDNIYNWAIEFNSEMIGSISVTQIDEKNCSCEIGYCIGYNYWNQGLVSESLYAVMNFLFSKVNVHRIVAKHDVENPASGKVMEKCNMTYEGTLREHYLRHDNTYSDSKVYGILESEFLHDR